MNDRMTPLAAAIFATLYPASAALAQRTASEGAKLEEVVVTATRRELNLQDVGQSVTAISTEDIQKQAFQSLDDVVSALPSVNLINSLPGRNNLVIRGISTGSYEYYTDSMVAVYLDDQPMTAISQQVDVRLIDIERVEMLPGPQGTLFGSSSQGGTIRYITNKPSSAGFSSQVDFEAGTTKGGEESYDISGHVNIPLSDKIAIRAVGFYAEEGGYVDNVLGSNLADTRTNADVVEEDWNDYKVAGGRVAGRWQISPEWESTLSLISQFSDSDGVWSSDEAVGDYKIVSFFDEFRDDDWYQASANIKGDLGFAELSFTASYFDRDIKYEWDNVAYENWRTAYYTATGYYQLWVTDYHDSTIFNDQKQNRWAYELRLTSQGESKLQWMAGAFYEDVYDWWDYGANVVDLPLTSAWAYAQGLAYTYGYYTHYPLTETDDWYDDIFEKTVRQKAVFGEVTYAVTDRWAVTGGARWFEFDRHEIETVTIPRGFPLFDFDENGDFFLAEPVEASGKDDDLVFKFGTQFKIDDDRMIYALYSEGFRLGGNNSPRAAQSGALPQTYDPDKLENYEVGIKSKWLDNRLLLNASLFYMEWSDIQLSTGGGDNDPWWLRGTFNGSKAEQKGIELNGEWRVTDNFTLEGSAFLAEPEFSEAFVEPDGDVTPEGSPMPNSPEEKFWIAAEYRLPGLFGLDGEFWTRAAYTYQGEFWNSLTAIRNDNREQIIPSSSLTTLQLGYSSNTGWDAALVIRNLFDDAEMGSLSSSDYGTFFGDPRFRYQRTLERPRTISLAITKKW
jgi:outer membrane receptor protein involved in Fe transport